MQIPRLSGSHGLEESLLLCGVGVGQSRLACASSFASINIVRSLDCPHGGG